MISILSQHFLTPKIIIGLIDIRSEFCLETLSYYFTIENGSIINTIELNLGRSLSKLDFIRPIEGNHSLEMLACGVQSFLRSAVSTKADSETLFNLFLSLIIIYKTVKFTESKYL